MSKLGGRHRAGRGRVATARTAAAFDESRASAPTGVRTSGWSPTSVPPPQADVVDPTVVVPADLEVDDRLVGPVTFRLAGWLAVVAAGLTIAVLSWPAIGATAAGGLLVIVGAAGALIRPAGRPLLWWAGPMWAYRRRQRNRPTSPDHLAEPATDPTSSTATGAATRAATESATTPAHHDGAGSYADTTASANTEAAPATPTLSAAGAPKGGPALSWQTDREVRAARRAARRPAVLGLACAFAVTAGVAIPVRLAGSGHVAASTFRGAAHANKAGEPAVQPTPSPAPSLSASNPVASPAATAVPSAAVSLLNDLLLGDPLDGPSGGRQPSSSAPSSRPSAAPSSAAPSPDSSDDLLPLWLLLFLLDGGGCDSSC